MLSKKGIKQRVIYSILGSEALARALVKISFYYKYIGMLL